MFRCIALLSLAISTAWANEPTPLVHAHAHNDYEHARPLLDATDRGFCSIEADIYLVEGELLVAHNREDVKAGRTLESLYLKPLQTIVHRNGGRVYRGGPTITLLVDVKSEAESTYAALDAVLRRYADMLTVFRAGGVKESAVTVIVSGNRATATMAAQAERYAAADGRREDLEKGTSSALVPLISENWKKFFRWEGRGEMPEEERRTLREWVERAHAQRKKVRFWNTPERVEMWAVLRDAGVDLIGTDDLAKLQRFSIERRER